MKMKHILLTLLLIISLCSPVWGAGTAYYADLTDTGSNNEGTFAEPFNSLTTINNYAFQTSDDLYFKAATSRVSGYKRLPLNRRARDIGDSTAYFKPV